MYPAIDTHSVGGVATLTLNPAVDQSVAVPGFAAGCVNRVSWHRFAPAGKGVNVACILADLGFRVAASGLLGGENADLFEQLFAAKGILDAFVRVPGRTRINVKIIDEVRRLVTEVNFPGTCASSDDLVTLTRQVDSLCFQHHCFVLSGSVPAGVPSDYYATLIRDLKAKGKRVLLDSSGESLRRGVVAAPWAIKPNLVELEELMDMSLPGHGAVIEAARRLLADGIGHVVVSMGQDGAIFVTRDQCLFALPPSVEIKTTVGAGDAMVAGFLAGALRGLPLPDTARLATASAAAALTQVPPRSLSAEVVEALVPFVEVCDLLHSGRG